MMLRNNFLYKGGFVETEETKWLIRDFNLKNNVLMHLNSKQT